MRQRYEKAKKREKGRILDEFCQTSGLQRQAAIRLLGRGRVMAPVPKKRGRSLSYGPELTGALAQVWEAGREPGAPGCAARIAGITHPRGPTRSYNACARCSGCR